MGSIQSSHEQGGLMKKRGFVMVGSMIPREIYPGGTSRWT